MRNLLFLNANGKKKIVYPVFTAAQAKNRPFAKSEDTRGEFIACRLGNHWGAQLYGWYMLVSPDDIPFVKRYNWCGNICGDSDSQHITVRRRESINGQQQDVLLHHDIWERHTGTSADVIHRIRHPLDFRRDNLSLPATVIRKQKDHQQIL